jgi:hypothetical protein
MPLEECAEIDFSVRLTVKCLLYAGIIGQVTKDQQIQTPNDNSGRKRLPGDLMGWWAHQYGR